MKKLNNAVARFAYNHPHFGIPNLMRIVVIGQAVIYFAYLFTGRNYALLSFLDFNLQDLLHGEVWRLVSFVFLPNSYRPITFLLLLSFYYFVGGTLEREWGTAKFCLYYFSGMALSVLATALTGLAFGAPWLSLSSAYYLNLTLFLAFAVLYPNAQILLYFIIPLKAKWIAWADCALIAFRVVSAVFSLDWVGVVTPIVMLANFLVFFWPELAETFAFLRRRASYKNSHHTIQFQQAARRQEHKAQSQGYHHKCSVCGRTDTDFPDLQFRYCSRCAGYHCFCEDHIFHHEHFTE